jgi:apolipoprotein N-acyltransferase
MRKSGGLSSGVRLLVLPAALILASAVILTVIQAPIDWALLAWIAYVPFTIACCRPNKPRYMFPVAYVIACFYWAGNLYWIFPVTIVGGITICLYTALLWPVLAICLRFCRPKRIPLFLAAGVLIVGIERMQGLFLGGFFWRFLAHSQYENTTIIQIADIFGAGGVSFLIAMVNGLIAELILDVRPKVSTIPKAFGFEAATHRLMLSVGLVSAAVIATVAYGRWRIGQEEHCIEPGPLAASLQSNVPQSVKRTFESGDKLFNDLMEHSRAAVEAGAELIVWPETMVQAMLDTDIWPYLTSPQESIKLDKRLREHAEGTAYLLVGAYGAEVRQRDSERYLARFNSAFFYQPDGQKSDKRYDKIHLVPFGEVLPLRRTLSWFYELLMKIKFIPYNFDYSLDYGTNYTVFEMAGDNGSEQMKDYRFGVIICYEGTVPEIAREFALNEQGEKNLDWLVNISNDGWFVRFEYDKVRPSTELAQHAAVSAFRAVENRLAVLRSVNTGISCLIDSAGRIRDGYLQGTLPTEAMSRTGVDGWFTDRIPIDTRTSFFSRYGEWLDFSCELCVILLIIGLLSMKFFKAERWKKRSLKRSNEKSAGQS